MYILSIKPKEYLGAILKNTDSLQYSASCVKTYPTKENRDQYVLIPFLILVLQPYHALLTLSLLKAIAFEMKRESY